MNIKKGKLFVVSAPSGAGKTTLVKEVITRLSHECSLQKVITYTTKQPRPGERQGIDYHFLDEYAFKTRIKEGFFVEYSTVYSAYYGFPKEVFSFLDEGKSYMGIVDLAGAASIKAYSSEAILIGIRPPDPEALAQRLAGRAEDTDEAIVFRLGLARDELDRINESFFKHIIINDVLNEAVDKLTCIVRDELS